jgi:hypothetical protein
LACLHHSLNIYSYIRQSLQILFPILGSHDVRSNPIEAIPVEGAKHPVLLVETVRTDAAAGTLQGAGVVRQSFTPGLAVDGDSNVCVRYNRLSRIQEESLCLAIFRLWHTVA